MKIDIGKHKGKSVGMVVLKHPDYVKWVLEKSDAEGQLRDIQMEMRRLLSVFNSKPFNKKCAGTNCNKPVAKCTVYRDNVYGPHWWCANHNPYESGANTGTLYEIRTYGDVVRYVKRVCGNRKSASVSLIKSLAQAKGLPNRVGENEVSRFFNAENII
jgi:hypothetical protein